jgi:hypothetical protein
LDLKSIRRLRQMGEIMNKRALVLQSNGVRQVDL